MAKERLVYNGRIFKIYEWKQRMFDGTYETFERMERPGTVLIIPSVGNKIAIAEEQQPGKKRRMGLFGGRMDKKGESPLQAAKRELMEESGMVATRWKLLKIMRFPSSHVKWDVYLFAAIDCRVTSKQHLDPGERITVKTISLDRLLYPRGLRMGPDTDSYLAELRSDKRKVTAFRKMLFG